MIEDFKFRGNWVRPEIFQMVADKLISVRAAFLVLLIDNLVEHGGRDCYATNDYFAGFLGVTTSQVKRLLQELKKQELIIQTGFNGRRRELSTAWSRLDAPDSGGAKMRWQGAQKCAGRGRSNAPAEDSKSGSNRTIVVRKITDSTPLNTRVKVQVHCDECKEVDWSAIGKQLVDAIPRRHYEKATPTGAVIRQLHTKHGVPPTEIQKAMTWYCKALHRDGDINRPGCNPNFLPVLFYGSSFVARYGKLLDAMTRAGDSVTKPKRKRDPRHGEVEASSYGVDL